MDVLEIERRGPAAWLWLNRPELRNALDGELQDCLLRAFEELEDQKNIRVLVLAGRGQAFCAGGDLSRMEQAAKMTRARSKIEAGRFAKLLYRMHSYPKPLIARVHGAAFAGGMGLLAACDIAIAAVDTEFCLSEVKLGLAPATISPYVIAAMGERAARRYFLTAERFTAAEAYRIGLIQELAPMEELDARVNEILGELVQGGPAAQAATKDLIGAVARAPLSADLIADTATRIAAIRVSPEGQEGVRAFLEKRQPAWLKAAKSASRKPRRKDTK